MSIFPAIRPLTKPRHPAYDERYLKTLPARDESLPFNTACPNPDPHLAHFRCAGRPDPNIAPVTCENTQVHTEHVTLTPHESRGEIIMRPTLCKGRTTIRTVSEGFAHELRAEANEYRDSYDSWARVAKDSENAEERCYASELAGQSLTMSEDFDRLSDLAAEIVTLARSYERA